MREELLEICSRHGMTLQEHVPLSEHTTFRIGGQADFWAEVNAAGLAELVRFCQERQYPYFVMGKGSNILASDEGFRGVILHLDESLCEIRQEENTLVCGAGASLAAVSKKAETLGLSGMEGLSGIPGTIGGALYMNAGAYGYEMAQIVTECSFLDEAGNIRTLPAEALSLSYRHSIFTERPGIILSVTVRLTEGDRTEISAKMQDLLKRRSDKQPLNYPSAGSTFKRPEGSYASKLIDECGLKGITVGGAQVSEKHAGFVINRDHATCAEVLELCGQVQHIVEEQTGFRLELEPILLGGG